MTSTSHLATITTACVVYDVWPRDLLYVTLKERGVAWLVVVTRVWLVLGHGRVFCPTARSYTLNIDRYTCNESRSSITYDVRGSLPAGMALSWQQMKPSTDTRCEFGWRDVSFCQKWQDGVVVVVVVVVVVCELYKWSTQWFRLVD